MSVSQNSLKYNLDNPSEDNQCLNNIYLLPPILIISLNRGENKDFNCIFDFPEMLNLKKYVKIPQSYQYYKLKSVITNIDKTGNKDCFISFCRHRLDGKWYCYKNDLVTYCNDQKNDFK